MFRDLDSLMHVMMDGKGSMAVMGEERFPTPVHPGSETLRRAIRENIVSFPSQIPALLKCPPADTQWRIVLLFFVRGWSSSKIGARYHVPRHRIWKILNGWSVRALALGYIQVIDREAFAACCHVDVEQAAPAALAHNLPAAAVERSAHGPVQVRDTGIDPSAAIDAAIAQYEAWSDEFQVRTATLLRELRTLSAAVRVGESTPAHELRRRGEERVSHAVA